MINIRKTFIYSLLLGLIPVWGYGQMDSIAIRQLLDSSIVALKKNDLKLTRKLLDMIYDLNKIPYQVPAHLLIQTLVHEAAYYDRVGTYEDGLGALARAEDILDSLDQPDIQSAYKIIHGKAALHGRLGHFQKTMEFAEQAYEFALKQDTQDRMIMNALNILASAHFLLYNIETAIELNDKLLVLVEEEFGQDHPFLSAALSNQANNYVSLKRFDIAISYLHRARMILEKKDPDQFDLQRLNYLIGVCLKRQGRFREAIKYLEEAIRITALFQPTHQFIGEDHREIGECEKALGNTDSALDRFSQALNIYVQRGQEKNFMVARVYLSFAQLFEEMGDHAKALQYFDKAAKHSEERLGPSHPNVSTYTREKALIESKLGQFDRAKRTVNRCLEMLQAHQGLMGKEHMVAKKHLLHALSVAGLVYLRAYKITCEIGELEQALALTQRALSIVTVMRENMETESDKLKFGAESIDIYAQAVEVAYLLQAETGDHKYADLALRFSEQSRNSTMLESLLRKMSDGLFGMPARIQIREKSLAIEMQGLEDKLITVTSEEPCDKLVADSLEENMFQIKENQRLLRDTIKTQYPEYFAVRYAETIEDIGALKRLLNLDQCIVQYFDAEEYIYVFALMSNQLIFRRIDKDNLLTKDIAQFITQLTVPDSIMLDPARSQMLLGASAFQLYSRLIHPLGIPGNIEELIVIPDGLEAKLPFDILLSQEISDGNEPRKWPYLFKDFRMTYAQSIAAWLQQGRLKSVGREFVGFAPEYDFLEDRDIDTFDQPLLAMIVRDAEGHLPFSPKEVITIRDITGGKTYIGSEATERMFRNQCNKFQIIHMSAHAILDDQFPGRNRFLLSDSNDPDYDDQLTASEICHLNLSAELAVLSACHTGAGVINRGEGIMSLGRAFAFAGVPATVQSLWRVPDETTARLMPYFYRGLKKGLPKHEALNAARIEYLDQTSISTQRHPYFWAGFILYGNTAPLSVSSNHYSLSWILLVGLLIGVALLFRRQFYS